jgi:vacuolar-type H+-ATPase subunit C/Vma6
MTPTSPETISSWFIENNQEVKKIKNIENRRF